VIDVAPTILEAAGLPEPTSVNGVPQIPMAGTSLVYSFDDATANERHTTQYFEIGGEADPVGPGRGYRAVLLRA
jgi:arylsulfatase